MRRAAVERLTDQRVLADVAKNDDDDRVRRAAVERLTDQRVLADVAKNEKDDRVRRAAVERLGEQSVLADVANNDKDNYVRMAAVERLTDQRVLADAAKNDDDGVVRLTAVERLTDQAVLADLANNAKDGNVRVAAVERLTDQAVLADFANKAEDENVRAAAMESVTDQTILAALTKNDQERFDRLVEQLRSPISAERRLAAQGLESRVSVGQRMAESTRKIAPSRRKELRQVNHKAICPLFDALMNSHEEEETTKAIALALFASLWAQVDESAQLKLLDLSRTNPSIMDVAFGDLVSKTALGGTALNAGQTGRISLMTRVGLASWAGHR